MIALRQATKAMHTLGAEIMRKTVDLAAAMAAIENREAEQLTLRELVAAFYARNLEASGEERLRKWLDALGDTDAWAITTEQLDVAADALRTAGYAESSISRDISALGSVYRWAKKGRLAPRGFVSPTLSVNRGASAIRRVEISDEELKRLREGSLASRSKGFTQFVHALIDSGARKSEILERRWRDFDPEAGTLTAETTKTGVPRVLFLQPTTVALFRRLGGASPRPDALILPGRYPDQPNGFRRPWARLTADIGRPDLRMHDIRHAVAARLLRAGNSLAIAAQVLGHSPDVLHQRYGHLETAALRKAQESAWRATSC